MDFKFYKKININRYVILCHHLYDYLIFFFCCNARAYLLVFLMFDLNLSQNDFLYGYKGNIELHIIFSIGTALLYRTRVFHSIGLNFQ